MKTKEVLDSFEVQGFEAGGGSPDDLGRFVRDEIAKWAPIIKAAGIQRRIAPASSTRRTSDGRERHAAQAGPFQRAAPAGDDGPASGIDAVILRGTENSKYISEFFHNGGNLGYRPFTVFYFRDPARKPAFVVPAVDLHLAMTSTWIEDVRAYAMAEFFTDVDVHFYPDFFEAAQAILGERNVKGMTIGTEGENLTSGFRARLDDMLAGNTLVDVALDMDIVRMVKNAGGDPPAAPGDRDHRARRTKASAPRSSRATPTRI